MDKKEIKFSENLFWDVDENELDMEQHKEFIIERVLDYGRWEDWTQIRSYYSMQTIKDAAMNARTLFPKTLSYIALYTDTNKEDYRCFKFAQLHPTLWNSYEQQNNRFEVIQQRLPLFLSKN
jgi:hypothetical protein